MPKYTFLLPAFKVKYLVEMLESIKNQTYTNFRVIISDDYSHEDIYKACEPYLSDSRFSYRRNEKNMGSKSLVSHWNILVDMCYTEFLILASDDDVYAPTFLEEIDILQQRYPKVDLLRASVQRIDDKGNITEKEILIDEFIQQTELILYLASANSINCLANYVFRTSRLQKNNGFIEFPLAWFSDDATAIKSAFNGVASTSKILFNFRTSQINISSINDNDPLSSTKKVMACMQFIEWIEKEKVAFYEHNMTKGFLELAIANSKHRAYYHATCYLKFADFCEFKNALLFFYKYNLIGKYSSLFLLMLKWIKHHLI